MNGRALQFGAAGFSRNGSSNVAGLGVLRACLVRRHYFTGERPDETGAIPVARRSRNAFRCVVDGPHVGAVRRNASPRACPY